MMPISFINADLILKSEESLDQLINWFGDAVFLLHHGKVDGMNLASFEVSLSTTDAELTLIEFCRLAEGLSDEGKHAWQGCLCRIADIAFESGVHPTSFSSTLQAATVQRLADLGIAITITIYPVGAYAGSKDGVA